VIGRHNVSVKLAADIIHFPISMAFCSLWRHLAETKLRPMNSTAVAKAVKT